MKRQLFSVIAAIALTATPAFAAGRNPQSFTVAGMRLGMTPHEILTTLKQRHDRVTNVENVGCFKDTLAGIRSSKDPTQPTIDPHCIGIISTDIARIYFIEDYPAHQGMMRAYSIEYTNAGSASALQQALIARYGEPSWSFGTAMAWCGPRPVPKLIAPALNPCTNNEPTRHPELDGSLGSAAGNVDPNIGSVGLSFSGTTLHLYDWGFAASRNEALIKAQNSAINAATKTTF